MESQVRRQRTAAGETTQDSRPQQTAGLKYRSALDRYTAAEARTSAARRAILQVRPRRLCGLGVNHAPAELGRLNVVADMPCSVS